MTAQAPRGARFDILIVPSRPAFRVSEQGVKALMRWFAASQTFVERSHAITDTAVELVLAPDMYAHSAFAEGAAPAEPPLAEAVLRFGSEPVELTYGDPGRVVHFYLELVGARYLAPHADFLDRLHQIIYLRPEFFIRPHAEGAHTLQTAAEGGRLEVDVGRRAAVTIVDKEDF